MTVTLAERLTRSRRHWRIRIGTVRNRLWCWWIEITQERVRDRRAKRIGKYGHD